MNTLSPQAVNLLKRVQQRITEMPEKYCQWNTCGTAYCVAGHLLDLCGIEHNNGGVGEMASGVLGIEVHGWQEHELFFDVPSLADGRRNFDHISRAAAGVVHIQSFIDKYTVN